MRKSIRLKPFYTIISFSLLMLVTTVSSGQTYEYLLNTPQKTVHTFLHWQLDGHKDETKAALTMLADSTLDKKERIQLSRRLLSVLDAKGLIIDYSVIPNKANYLDTLSNDHIYILFNTLPEVYLQKYGKRWLFSEAAIQSIPRLYDREFSFIAEVLNEKVPDSWRNKVLGLSLWQYAAIFIWILFGLIIKKLFELIFENHFRKLAAKTELKWDDVLVNSVEKPISYAVMIIYLYLTYSNLYLPVNVNHFLIGFFEVMLSFFGIWLLYNMTDVLSDYLMSITSRTESKLDDQLVPLLRKSLKVSIVVIGLIFLLQNNGINVASLLAGLGLGGLAFALAAKDTLANFFGSVTIFLDKPFQVGDWIKSGEIEGTVEEVGFRSTRIRTFYNSLISVPNSKMADSAIDNLGMREYRRIKMILNLHYATPPKQLEAFVEGIKAIIVANPFMRKDFFEVHFNQFGPHSLDILVYCFLKVPSWSDELKQKHNFFMAILNLAKDVGVEFAYPTQSLHIDSAFMEKPRKIGSEKEESELAAMVYQYGPDGQLSNPDRAEIKDNKGSIDFSGWFKTRGS